MPIKPLLVFVPALLLVACNKPAPPPPAPAAAQPAAVTQTPGVASAWSGRWSGPEATFLDVLQDGPKLSVAITNLDGVRRFEATEIEGGLSFRR